MIKYFCFPAILFLVLLTGCSTPPRAVVTSPATQSLPPQSTVVWVSLDGFSHEYLQAIHPPTLGRLAAEGAWTTQEKPIFPSLTFPNHTAQATGTTVDHHGIPMNSFYDPPSQKIIPYPNEVAWLRADPIWATAERQGVRSAVFDWPVSYSQTGPGASEYFDKTFDAEETDQHRLDRVMQILNADHNPEPLRLVMTYMSHVDKIGHKNGPGSPETAAALLESDKIINQFFQSVLGWFDRTHRSEDELYFLVTADHGMGECKTIINLDRLIGADLVHGVKIVTSGPMACIYLTADDPAKPDKIIAKLRTNTFLTVWKSEDVPAEYHFADPNRIGQIVVQLAPGYSFTPMKLATRRPETPGPHGMHGYDPNTDPDMKGAAIVWRYRKSIGGINLGPIDNTQWQATVAGMLGIEPAAGSDLRRISLR